MLEEDRADKDVPYHEVKAASEDKSNNSYKGKLFFMGGKPYVGEPPVGFMPKPKPGKKEIPSTNKSEQYSGEYYLVDGDNHVYEALQGTDSLSECDTVMVYVTQEGLRDNLSTWYGKRINIVMVESGDQAADNKIIANIENIIKNREFKKIHVISHDKGYLDFIKKYRKKYKLKDNELNLKESIELCKR